MKSSQTSFQERFETAQRPRVLVVGDLMLDRYVCGEAERVSPEAPVLVVRAETEEVRPGGAASVAALCRGLEADVALLGAVGDDADGRVLRRLLEEGHVDDSLVLVDESRRTTAKERILGRTMGRAAQQILRVDYERRQELSEASEEEIWHRAAPRLSEFDAILISDYAKGIVTRTLAQRLVTAGRALGLPVLVDPGRGVGFESYRGATIVKPNRFEAATFGKDRPATPEAAIEAGAKLCETYDFNAVVVTLDDEGMVVVERRESGSQGRHIPARQRSVCDVTGAGDTVFAVLGLWAANGLPLDESAKIANAAAGLQVERQGVAVISRREIENELSRRHDRGGGKLVCLEEMAAIAARMRNTGQSLVFTNGCFDLLHFGHATYLQEAATLGHALIVAINSDASVKRLKGATRPIIGESERAAILTALSCVDYVLIFEEDTPHRALEAIRPNVLAKGGTYDIEGVVGREIVNGYGGKVCVVGQVPGISTTNLISNIKTLS